MAGTTGALSVTRRGVMLGMTAMLTAPARAYQTGVPPTLTPARMQADIALLRASYTALHPGLLRYQTAAQADAGFDRLVAACARPMTLGQFYLALSRTLATVRCGHSYANFYNQTAAVRAALFDPPPRLPLSFRWIGGRMIATADPFATGIVSGSDILAINGRPAGAVLDGLVGVTRADGHNDAKRHRLLSVRGGEGYETFDVFHALMFGAPERFRLVVRGPDGRRRTADLAGVSLDQRRASAPKRPEARGAAPIWTMGRTGDAALLTMPSWGLYDSKWDWRAWLDDAFDRIVADGAPRLVIDLRGNEGGLDSCGEALASRLVAADMPYNTDRKLVRYRIVPADLKPHLESWDRRFDDWGADASPYDARFLELTGGRDRPAIVRPRGARYAGDVTVLIDADNSSATVSFARFLRQARRATFVGEATGGNLRGINASAFYFLRLPETGVEVDVPLIGTFPRVAAADAGFIPDRVIRPTAADIAAGRDPVLGKI